MERRKKECHVGGDYRAGLVGDKEVKASSVGVK
jgi:hypothetical protein